MKRMATAPSPHADKASLLRPKRRSTALMQMMSPCMHRRGIIAHDRGRRMQPRQQVSCRSRGAYLFSPREGDSRRTGHCVSRWGIELHTCRTSFSASEGDVSRTTIHQAWAARRHVNPRGYPYRKEQPLVSSYQGRSHDLDLRGSCERALHAVLDRQDLCLVVDAVRGRYEAR